MAYPKATAQFTCTRGCKHYTRPGNLRGLVAAAKRGYFGYNPKRLAKAGEPFILCPDVYDEAAR